MTVLTVYGAPAPKGSRTLGRRRDGTMYTRPASNREHAWVRTVAEQAQWCATQSATRPDPPYAVALTFYLRRPAQPAHPYPSRLDVDKLARAVLDGLVTGGLLEDDRHVTELAASKTWATTGDGECCHVSIDQASAEL